ncbi:hypothetical protein SAMN00777080_3295 [Aquiflexum balticum DSM 16537]|uniref:Uncharacterized protein n=1 Tax=Aquiflexum balticum DSM 16537 TaxID=758820 RepID=A0A1W2H738_9BACT|nr:hypothetical protein SAMN00777080_3295 [Aquiflexum balticum DSM 16537]
MDKSELVQNEISGIEIAIIFQNFNNFPFFHHWGMHFFKKKFI